MRSRRDAWGWAWTLTILAVALAVTCFVTHAVRGEYQVNWRYPWALLVAISCLWVGWQSFHRRHARAPLIAFSRAAELARLPRGKSDRFRLLPDALRVAALGVLALALARPVTVRTITKPVDSIDIMLVLDLSRSMEERDLPRDRLDAAQRVVRNFIAKRANDRVGLVIFGQGAMLQCPLTLDLDFLDRVVADLQIGDIPEFGTAIGDGLALGVAQLRRAHDTERKASSKVVILLSDGDSNWVTRFSPSEATKLAAAAGVRVFTVLIGREDPLGIFGETVNPQTLRNIASKTGGEYFRAEDETRLDQSFRTVREQLDKQVRIKKERKQDAELGWPLLLVAVVLVALEQLLARTWLRRLV